MEKRIWLGLALSALALGGCGGSSSSAPESSSGADTASNAGSSESTGSSSASKTTSENSASSSEDLTDFYLAGLETKTSYYSIRRSLNVTKDGTVFKNGYDYKLLDIANEIEHLYGSETTIAGYEDNDDTIATAYDIYNAAEATYTKGYDGKYHVTTLTTPAVFEPYVLTYDYSVAVDLSVSYDGFDAILSGAIPEASLTEFLTGSTALSGVTDFAFSATLSKSAAELSDFTFAYTQNTYSVKIVYVVSALAQSITLPTV
jgi:hypothetical protein